MKRSDSIAIKILGVGDAGVIALEELRAKMPSEEIEFLGVNTGRGNLRRNIPMLYYWGPLLYNGTPSIPLACGTSDSLELRQWTTHLVDQISSWLDGADLFIIVVGLGGRTGTGIAPLFAERAKDFFGIPTMTVAFIPFSFEGEKHRSIALRGLEVLKKHSDCVYSISGDKIAQSLPSPEAEQIGLCEIFSIIVEHMHRPILTLTKIVKETAAHGGKSFELRTLAVSAGLVSNVFGETFLERCTPIGR